MSNPVFLGKIRKNNPVFLEKIRKNISKYRLQKIWFRVLSIKTRATSWKLIPIFVKLMLKLRGDQFGWALENVSNLHERPLNPDNFLKTLHVEQQTPIPTSLTLILIGVRCSYVSRGTAFAARLHMRPAKTQMSLRIRAVWSESSQGALWVADSKASLSGQWRLWSAWTYMQADLSLLGAYASL